MAAEAPPFSDASVELGAVVADGVISFDRENPVPQAGHAAGFDVAVGLAAISGVDNEPVQAQASTATINRSL